MQKLLPLLLSIAACSFGIGNSQTHYYCNSREANQIRATNFTIITRNLLQFHYDPGLNCSFRVLTPGVYFVEFVVADAEMTSLILRSDSQLLNFNGDVKPERRSLLLKNGSVSVEFLASSTPTGKRRGFELKLTRVTQCPPGWLNLMGTCFGTSRVKESQLLNYSDAQNACNNMGGNLLHPLPDSSSIRSLRGLLPTPINRDVWIGVTGVQSEGKSYKWLSGEKFQYLSEIRCDAGWIFKNCAAYAACGAFSSASEYTVSLQFCYMPRRYACSMSADSNRSVFYRLPMIPTPPLIIYAEVLVLPVLAFLCCCCCCCCCVGPCYYKYQKRKAAVSASSSPPSPPPRLIFRPPTPNPSSSSSPPSSPPRADVGEFDMELIRETLKVSKDGTLLYAKETSELTAFPGNPSRAIGN